MKSRSRSAGPDLAGLQILDVRNEGESRLGVIPGAVVIPLARLLDRLGELDPSASTVVHCPTVRRRSCCTAS